MGFEIKIAVILLLGISTASSSDNTEFLTSFHTFNQELFGEIVKSHGEENVIYSPFSIHSCLSMTRMAADGQTALEMDQGLGFTGQKSESVADNYYSMLAKYENSDILTIANKVYVMKGYELQDNYNKLLSKKFFSSAENIDFSQSDEAAHTINSWVEAKTNDKVKNLIPASVLNDNTRLTLLNAVYFNGKWDIAFDKEKTSERQFFINESDSVQVQTMVRNGECAFHMAKDLDARVVRLPYKDSDLSMLVIFPSKRSGVAELEKRLRNFNFNSLGVKYTRPKCKVFLPKFKTEFQIELTDTLKEMGMKEMFTSTANFGKMLKGDEHLHISKVFHKAIIDVSEEGTVAAAATGVVKQSRIAAYTIEINHPFVYAIVNDDYVPLFQGVVTKP